MQEGKKEHRNIKTIVFNELTLKFALQILSIEFIIKNVGDKKSLPPRMLEIVLIWIGAVHISQPPTYTHLSTAELRLPRIFWLSHTVYFFVNTNMKLHIFFYHVTCFYTMYYGHLSMSILKALILFHSSKNIPYYGFSLIDLAHHSTFINNAIMDP